MTFEYMMMTDQGLLGTGPKQGTAEIQDQLPAGFWARVKAFGLPVVEAVARVSKCVTCLPYTAGQKRIPACSSNEALMTTAFLDCL